MLFFSHLSYASGTRDPLVRPAFWHNDIPLHDICVSAGYKAPLVLFDHGVSTLSNLTVGSTEHAVCMAVDQTGILLLLGYGSLFRVCFIQSGSLRMLHSQPTPEVVAMQFTTYGNLFAVMTRTELRMYDSYNF